MPVTVGKCKKKSPRKIHKAEREEDERDLFNYLFGELGEIGVHQSLTSTPRRLCHSQHALVTLSLNFGGRFLFHVVIWNVRAERGYV